MKTIKLFLKFSFTSLSPDAQPISLAVVSEDMKLCDFPNEYPEDKLISFSDYKKRSFYAEFSDFDINRCDDWVKENVISKLSVNSHAPVEKYDPYLNNVEIFSSIEGIKQALSHWLHKFSDYDIQFVTDCGWFNWNWMVQLLAQWEEIPNSIVIPEMCIPNNMTICDFIKEWKESPVKVVTTLPKQFVQVENVKIGLPKLPSNISPVPEDLNDLIARSKGISIREAFNVDREELSCVITNIEDLESHAAKHGVDKDGLINPIVSNKFNALWDAKVIKTIYNKLSK